MTTPCNILVGADDDVGRWIAARIDGAENWVPGSGRAIGFTYGDRLIAGAGFFRYNGANVEVTFASEDPRWLTRENLRILFEYPFRQLRLRRITTIADSTNYASRRFNEALGFVHEATLERACADGDLIVYRMYPEDCKWLTKEGLARGDKLGKTDGHGADAV